MIYPLVKFDKGYEEIGNYSAHMVSINSEFITVVLWSSRLESSIGILGDISLRRVIRKRDFFVGFY